MRVTGPSFDLVSGWADQGIPLKIAFQGIDRYFERYYRKGPRRRPVKIDFCDADVLDAFDEWRRALGLARSGPEGQGLPRRSPQREDEEGLPRRSPQGEGGKGLPAHLQRVVLRLTGARANGSLGDAFDTLVDRVARELDVARASAGGVRGDARQALIIRLSALDAELLTGARQSLDEADLAALIREAHEELADFRERMTADAYERAHENAVTRLIRARLQLPTIAFG
ncbi:MAG TPA: hypothetical protein VGJ29_06440 [Vicinamibacterales bacterium]